MSLLVFFRNLFTAQPVIDSRYMVLYQALNSQINYAEKDMTIYLAERNFKVSLP